jgi:hypothetical protein
VFLLEDKCGQRMKNDGGREWKKRCGRQQGLSGLLRGLKQKLGHSYYEGCVALVGDWLKAVESGQSGKFKISNRHMALRGCHMAKVRQKLNAYVVGEY